MSDPTPSADNSPPASPSHESIVLQVGERRFTTLASTLSGESAYFASLLSGRCSDSQSSDGSYFIDADPDLFAHILRYLRRGVLPIIYDKSNGFDHAFYVALKKEAEYFGIEPLRKWAQDKGYMQAITIKYSVEEVTGEEVHRSSYDATVDADKERLYYPSWGIEKVYQCPRGISLHDGNPRACGRACTNAKGKDEDEYLEQNVLRILIVTKATKFNFVGN
ncbi:MAG: hypothetical protein M1824_001958 [Vezdaea acicularis]|nr:MAG: hypothetical protein M1824_001958 [Vezdaea acicularis]